MAGIKISPLLVLGAVLLLQGTVLARHHHRPVLKQTASSAGVSAGVYNALSLNTTRLFGLYLSGNFTILNSFRNKVMDRFSEAYTDTQCDVATDETRCNSEEEVIVARRQAVVARRQGLYQPQHSRQKRLDTAVSMTSCGVQYSCFASESLKRQIEQKCWLFDIFGGVSQNTLHQMPLAGTTPTWKDISNYLTSFGDKLVKPDTSIQYSNIYREIECELRAMKDTKSEAVVKIFNLHAQMVESLHEYFLKLRNANRKGTDVNCFASITTFLEQLTKLGGTSHTHWEDVKMFTALKVMLGWLDDPTNSANQHYATPNSDVYFCHHKILVAYTNFKKNRTLALEELEKKFEVDPLNTDGLIREMADNVFEPLTKLLLKTMLMSGTKRFSDYNKETTRVEKVYKELVQKLKSDVRNFSPERFWKTRIDRLEMQINKSKA